MAKQNIPTEKSLFEDLSLQDPLSYNEQIEMPANDSLAQIEENLRATSRCGGCQSGLPVVFGIGPAPAHLMIIGEGPGADDATSAMPFQGQAGMLLNRMMAAIDRTRTDSYLCNVIKCIPAGGRNFTIEEIEDCRPFLLRQILAVRPKVILALGALAAQTLLRSKKTISELRGNEYLYQLNELHIILIPTFNPAYLLRVAEKKRESWEDLKLARKNLQTG